MPDNVLLTVENLAVRIGRNPVLHDVTFTVGAGDAVAILGPNGAGKTTLLRTLSGVLRPAAGTIHFGGTALGSQSAWDVVRLGMSHVPQGRRCFGPLTVLENLRLGSYILPKEFHRELDRVLAVFPELSGKLRARAGSLSGGQQQMLAIARALMSRPRLLLLDEPSLGLSPLYVQQLAAFLKELCASEGLTILLVEQNLSVVQAVAKEFYLLRTGRTVSEARQVAGLDQAALAESYLSVS